MPAGPRELPHPDVDELNLAAVLSALSDPARLQIVRQLTDGPLTVAECGGDGMPKSTLSHQLKTLREAGLVRNTADGRQRQISLRREDLDARFPGLLEAVLSAAGQVYGVSSERGSRE